MRALCLILKKIWHPSPTLRTQDLQNARAVFNSGRKRHPSRTLRTQELQNVSAVFNSEKDLAPLSALRARELQNGSAVLNSTFRPPEGHQAC